MIARLLASLLFTFCLAGGAQAQVVWSTTANNCVPDDDTIKFERHKVNIASVEHATGNVGLITLNCRIDRFSDGGVSEWNIKLSYRDSTGTGTTAFVRARLYRMGTGGFDPSVIAGANSNLLPATGNNTALTGPSRIHSTSAQIITGCAWIWIVRPPTRSSSSMV